MKGEDPLTRANVVNPDAKRPFRTAVSSSLATNQAFGGNCMYVRQWTHHYLGTDSSP